MIYLCMIHCGTNTIMWSYSQVEAFSLLNRNKLTFFTMKSPTIFKKDVSIYRRVCCNVVEREKWTYRNLILIKVK